MSPRITGPYCLRFHFHMLGIAMGSLKVYKNSASSNTEVFSVNGNQGDGWYMAQTSVTGSGQFQVIKENFFSVFMLRKRANFAEKKNCCLREIGEQTTKATATKATNNLTNDLRT